MSFTASLRSIVVFFAGVITAVAVVGVFQGMRADAGGGNGASFVPIEPCRLLETRPNLQDTVAVPSLATKLGTAPHTVQGTGPMGNCDITSEAVGLVLNVTPVASSAATDIRLYPSGGTVPETANLNPAPGQPPTPNAVTVGLSGAGQFDILNKFGDVHVVIDVAGYYTNGLANRIAALEAANSARQAEIDALETLTASMSLETVDGEPVVRFTGVNVQVVSGSGSTDGVINGTGNLVVGYHENVAETRTGSHNLIIGERHSYSSYAGLVSGNRNTLSGANASVSGGFYNTASGDAASVSGGTSNTASEFGSSVSGGTSNTASGSSSSVSGGGSNTTSGVYASVSGGTGNTASTLYSSILGGRSNQVSGNHSTVAGGVSNNASGVDDVIAGGDNVECGYSDAVLCGEYTSFTAGWDLVD